MITTDEIRRLAARYGVDPMVVDHDYVIGCYLHFLARQRGAKQGWVFKGGTALQKCYFGDYRFSEDIDFTLKSEFKEDEIKQTILKARVQMQEEIGIRGDVRDVIVETVEDDYGKESFEAKLYYEGIWYARGSPRSIRVHLNRDEILAFPPQEKNIFHRFSDDIELPQVTIQTYALEEILAEKLRAFSGQRRFAVSRDIFDLYYLSVKEIDISEVAKEFQNKCAIKGIKTEDLSLQKVLSRKDEYRENWTSSLEYLVPHNLKVPFEKAWDSAYAQLSGILDVENARG